MDHADRIIELELLLARCRIVLGNMARENTTGWRAVFNRWPVHHEPLRNDAKSLVHAIDQALRRRSADGD